MKTERDLVLDFFDATEVSPCGCKAVVNNRWEFITDLIVKYRRNQKSKQTAKIRRQKIVAEFNLVRDTLVSEVEDFCNDLFRNNEDIVVFVNRSSVNVFDPITQTTVYTMLSPISHCICFKSKTVEFSAIKDLAKSLNYNVAKSKHEECMVNQLKETREVAEAIFDILLKVRYE